ncbi:oligosaccharide flippase family protein [Providencia rettgeri]|uniref:lipopolysaccharide biosynthesis protein n=1 Tax=Providencia TaxID=586 RepID=UPI0019090068|nr:MULTISPECIES: oligosaccharide flippase family protein [Providencia]ELR5266655.1 oligosaccharide flippase family protein [Providencia rettgeri]MBJ9970234.1 oligosaccharide flippase family protein [Providencia rettgeri]MCB6145426.1 oligosaccharide flippase family protein [Providencia rettgeri]MCF8962597.1 hypothetical protein [Providencia rettgeri]UDQ66777.1 oligosaccharide flippase family protein [Providencia rettgeri]
MFQKKIPLKINSKLKNIVSNKFIRNVIIIASGTAGAQIISMLFSPIITRLYGPEVFGILGTFTAILTVITPIAALTYPIAIVLPKSDANAKGIAILSIRLAILVSVLIALVLLIENDWIAHILRLGIIKEFLLFIPIVMFFSAYQEILAQWCIRKKQFKLTARVTIIQAIILNGAKAGLGLIYPISKTLIIITVFGFLINGILLKLGLKRQKISFFDKKINTGNLFQLAHQYSDFPLYRAPQVVLNALSQSLPILMLASFFGPASAGFYSIGRTVLGIPSTLIGKSVGDVFYPRISEAVNNKEKVSNLISKATILMSAVGIIPFGVVVIFGPYLFDIIFGSDWVVAGEYARWLALWLYFGFLNRPSVAAIAALKLQGFFLIYELISIVLRVGSLYMGFSIYNSDIIAIALFSICGVILNISLIIFTLKKSKEYLVQITKNNHE